jgi:butyrate response factor
MHFHPTHPLLPQLRTAKASDHSLDTSTESEDSGLLRQHSACQSPMPYLSHFSTKIKHSLCRNFTEQGFCPYGNRCQFAHGPSELRNNTPSNHSYKTRPCLAFSHEGYCLYGQRCNFIHERPRQGKEKWQQIYCNFREEKDMFRKGNEGGLMGLLGKEIQTQ